MCIRDSIETLAWGSIDPFFAGAVEAVEEAVINALVAARDMIGRKGHASFALPHDEVRAAFGIDNSAGPENPEGALM